MNSASLLEIKELGGWQTTAMVERYAHLASHHLKRVRTKIDEALDGGLGLAKKIMFSSPT